MEKNNFSINVVLLLAVFLLLLAGCTQSNPNTQDQNDQNNDNGDQDLDDPIIPNGNTPLVIENGRVGETYSFKKCLDASCENYMGQQVTLSAVKRVGIKSFSGEGQAVILQFDRINTSAFTPAYLAELQKKYPNNTWDAAYRSLNGIPTGVDFPDEVKSVTPQELLMNKDASAQEEIKDTYFDHWIVLSDSFISPGEKNTQFTPPRFPDGSSIGNVTYRLGLHEAEIVIHYPNLS